MGEGGWDLQAVVRGCSGPAAQEDLLSSFVPEILEPSSFSLYDLPSPPSDLHELEDLCKPFISKALDRDQRETKQDLVSPHRSSLSLSTPSSLSSRVKPLAAARKALLHTPTTKRRKNQQKKVVCHVPADKISSDLWAWRKYGQKPIKGSPFPRGYYKCSSSKGCMARKQVERSPVDPGVFIITYTAEHNHPIPIQRQKAADGQEGGADLAEAQCNATSSRSPSVQKEDDVEEALPHVGAEIMSGVEMGFLDGEEESEGGGAAAFAAVLSDHFGGGFPPPWLTSSATAV